MKNQKKEKNSNNSTNQIFMMICFMKVDIDCTYYDKENPWKNLSHNSYIMSGGENFARIQIIRKQLGLSGNKHNDELVRTLENNDEANL